MTPFASVAMLEKLALLKIAFCRAPAFKGTSSACLREVTSRDPSSKTSRILVTSFPLAMVLPPVTYTGRCIPIWRLLAIGRPAVQFHELHERRKGRFFYF